MAHKTYFAMPNFDYPPNHSIQLGQIITSPSTPWDRLAAPLAVPTAALQRSLKKDWGTEVRHAHENRLGVWAQFAAMICGIGADAVVAWSREQADLFQFAELETTFFDPDPDYVTASAIGPERTGVAEWIKTNRGKSVYMVTGVKIARVAQHLQSHFREFDAEFKPGANALPLVGVPVEGGPILASARSKGETTWSPTPRISSLRIG